MTIFEKLEKTEMSRNTSQDKINGTSILRAYQDLNQNKDLNKRKQKNRIDLNQNFYFLTPVSPILCHFGFCWSLPLSSCSWQLTSGHQGVKSKGTLLECVLLNLQAADNFLHPLSCCWPKGTTFSCCLSSCFFTVCFADSELATQPLVSWQGRCSGFPSLTSTRYLDGSHHHDLGTRGTRAFVDNCALSRAQVSLLSDYGSMGPTLKPCKLQITESNAE